jgi:hypothetical protein
MTEAEWLACEDPRRMLGVAAGRLTERKLWLFTALCWRRIGARFVDLETELADSARRYLRIVEVGEKYADQTVSESGLREVSLAVRRDAWETYRTAGRAAGFVHEGAIRVVRLEAVHAVMDQGQPFGTQQMRDSVGKAEAQECRIEAPILRHIIGNPFKSYPTPAAWPSAVVELAQALYDGAGDRLVLADALEEAGHGELAAHFRSEEAHPKGCFAMDLVLGKG